MTLRELVIHRWNAYSVTRYGRFSKGIKEERRKKWFAVKHLAKKMGLKIG